MCDESVAPLRDICTNVRDYGLIQWRLLGPGIAMRSVQGGPSVLENNAHPALLEPKSDIPALTGIPYLRHVHSGLLRTSMLLCLVDCEAQMQLQLLFARGSLPTSSTSRRILGWLVLILRKDGSESSFERHVAAQQSTWYVCP